MEVNVKEKALELGTAEDKVEAKKAIKKAKYIDNKNESLSFQCEQFFGKNWKYIAIFLCLSIIVFAYELSNISSQMKDLKKIVFENNSKVVLTTTDGRALRVIKDEIKAENLKQFATSTYVNSLIVSRSQLTKDFSQTSFNDYGEVFENVPNLKNILLDFMDSNKERDKEINQQAIGDLRAYVQWLMSATAQDKLPEYISLKNYTIDRYDYNANKFNIEISINTVSQSYILSSDKWVSQNGIFKIQSQGSFDLSKGTDINPYGMRIERIRVQPIVKGSNIQ